MRDRSAVLAHLRILTGLVGSARSEAARARVSAAVNEAVAFVGRLAFDLGDYAAFHRYYRLAVSYAEGAGDDALAAYTLGSMSYWSVMGGDGEQSLTAMEQAKSLLPKQVPPVVESWFAVFEASTQSKAATPPRQWLPSDELRRHSGRIRSPGPGPCRSISGG